MGGREGLLLSVLEHLEDVVGPAAAASLIRYATAEAARGAAGGTEGIREASDFLRDALGQEVKVVKNARSGLVVEVRGLETGKGGRAVPEALVLGVARGLYLGRFHGVPIAVDAERGPGLLRVTVRPEGPE